MQKNRLFKILQILSFALLCNQQLYAQATNKIDTTGHVGVGTLNPVTPLDVYDTSLSHRVLSIRRGAPYYVSTTYGKPYIALGGSEFTLGSIQSIGLGYTTNNSIQPAEIGFHTMYTGGYTYGDIVFATRNGWENIAPTEVARITSNGNVGIGSVNPSSRLEVYDELKASSRVLNIRRGAQGYASDLGTSFGNPYLTIGGAEYKVNSLQSIGFGYTTSGSMQAAEIGFKTMNTGGYTYGDIVFATRDGWENIAPSEVVRITSNGKVGIGTSSPGSYALAVNGDVKVRKLVVTQSNWPDYVFHSGYKLRSLSQVEQFIKANEHLPDMPPAKEMEKEGVNVGETQALLLKKIEELTLYLIGIQKENSLIRKTNAEIKRQNQKLAERVKKLETLK